MRFEVLMAVKMSMLVFGLQCSANLKVDTSVLEEHIASIFRAQVRLLGSG
jgi:hypothetical protein